MSDFNKWMPTIAGILNIISGALGIISCLLLIILAIVLHGAFNSDPSIVDETNVFSVIILTYFVIGIIVLLISVISIIGGIICLGKKHWGWALAGSICAVVNVIGIISVILVVLARKEFLDQGKVAD